MSIESGTTMSKRELRSEIYNLNRRVHVLERLAKDALSTLELADQDRVVSGFCGRPRSLEEDTAFRLAVASMVVRDHLRLGVKSVSLPV